MLKTYRIYREKTKPVTVRVDDEAVTPDFQQVGLFKDFSTRDAKIQQALESDMRFKSVYFLVYEENVPLSPPEGGKKAETKKQKAEKQQPPLTPPQDEPPLTPPKGENSSPPSEGLGEAILDITTTQAAKAFLRAKGIEISKFDTKEKVIAVAKANGIEFPNLI